MKTNDLRGPPTAAPKTPSPRWKCGGTDLEQVEVDLFGVRVFFLLHQKVEALHIQ